MINIDLPCDSPGLSAKALPFDLSTQNDHDPEDVVPVVTIRAAIVGQPGSMCLI